MLKCQPSDCVSTFASRSKLNINAELTKVCMFISKLVETRKYIPENTPKSVPPTTFFSAETVNNITLQQIH